MSPHLPLIALLLLIGPALSFTEEVVYEQATGENRVVYRDTRTATSDGYHITVTTAEEYNECDLDLTLSVRRWFISRPADGVRIEFERIENRIHAVGTFEDAPFARTYHVGDDPWYQFHELTLDQFAVSRAQEIEFWTIDRRNMRIVKFRAEKQGIESIEVTAGRWDAVRVEISLTGVARLLGWKSVAWLRRTDGRYLRFEAPGVTPRDDHSVVQLVSE